MSSMSSNKLIAGAEAVISITSPPHTRSSSPAYGGQHIQRYILVCTRVWRVPTFKANFNTLNPVVAWQPFEKWGIDFIGQISPTSNLNRYIITAIDYATKWAKAKARVNANARSTAKFLYENVTTWFGCPLEIISDQGSHFLNEVIAHLLGEFIVTHRKSSPLSNTSV